MTTTITRAPLDRHHVACDRFGYLAAYRDADVNLALDDYASHNCEGER